MNRRQVPVPSLPQRPVDGVVAGLRRLAFWAAVVLPLSYLPLLASPVGSRELLLIGCLVAVNVVCLLVGHDYSP